MNKRSLLLVQLLWDGLFSFRRWLTPNLILQEVGLLQLMNQINLSQARDTPRWKWSKDGKLSVKSIYKHLCKNGIGRSFRHLWKNRIPLKIKIWLWLIWHNVIATKDNLIKRNWARNPLCQFCREQETINHLFFGCVAAKFV
jgi:hypothetical protein